MASPTGLATVPSLTFHCPGAPELALLKPWVSSPPIGGWVKHEIREKQQHTWEKQQHIWENINEIKMMFFFEKKVTITITVGIFLPWMMFFGGYPFVFLFLHPF